MEEGRCVDTTSHFQVVVVDVLLGGDVGGVMVVGIEGVDEVGLTLFEHFGGEVPLLHDELMGDVEAVENLVEYLDVIAGGLTFVIEKLERLEVPVADNDKGLFLGITKGFLGGRSEK